MNSSDLPLDALEVNLRSLAARLPGLDVPVCGILLCRLIQHLGREMTVLLEQKIRPFGLAEAEFRALVALYSRPDGVAHPSDLCAGTSQSPANMSRISDALVDRGLITREMSVQDRRRMVLRVTEEGEMLVRRLLPAMFAPLHELFSDLSEAKQRQLVSVLRELDTKVGQAIAPNGSEAAE
jgi:MarR family transcriptional regulator, negative regulator of the multidrug operon emrRAB